MQKQISTIISLKDRFSQPLLKMSKNVDSLTKETRSSMNQVNRWGKQVERSVDRAVKATAKWAKRGALVAGGFAVKEGIQGIKTIDEYSRKVKAIAGDRMELGEIRDSLSDIRFELGVDMESVGETFYQALSTNIPETDLEDITRISHQLSVTGHTELDNALGLIATTANVFDMREVEGYRKIAEQALRTQQLGKIEVAEMADHYGKVSSLTQAIGGSFEEQSAALATMTMLGMMPSEATTGYRGILNAFLKNTTDARKAALREMGLGEDFLSAANYQAKGFGGIMREVIGAVGNDMDKIAKIFPELRGMTGFTKFLEGGDKEYFRIFEEIINAEGSLDAAYEAMDGSITRNWEKIKNRVNELNRKFFDDGLFGDVLADSLGDAAKWLENNETEIMNVLENISEKIVGLFKFIWSNRDTLSLVTQFLALLYMLVKATRGIESLGKALKAITDTKAALKLGQIVKGMAIGKLALIAAGIIIVVKSLQYLYKNWDEIEERFPAIEKLADFFRKFKGLDLSEPINMISWVFDIIKTVLSESIAFVSNWAMGIVSTLFGVVQTIIGLGQIVIGFIRGLVTGDFEIMKDGFSNVSEGMTIAWGGFTEFFTAAVESTINVLDTALFNKIDNIKNKWKIFKEFIEKPITGTVNLITGGKGLPSVMDNYNRGSKMPRRYKGTPNWRGGTVNVHERGGEILDLPGGTRIHPHDRSIDIAREDGYNLAASGMSGGQTQNINFGDLYFTGDIKSDMDINEIGTKFVETVKKELNNI